MTARIEDVRPVGSVVVNVGRVGADGTEALGFACAVGRIAENKEDVVRSG